MFRKITALVVATLAATPAIACDRAGMDELFYGVISSGQRSFSEPVPIAPPSFPYTDANGVERTLGDNTGKSMIVTFWHPDCIGCKVDLPRLDGFLKDNPDLDRDQFLQISIEELNEGPRNEFVDRDDVREFLASKSFDAIDGNVDMGNRLFTASCLIATPSHLMINREGKVTDVLFGPLKWAEEPFAGIARNYLANF